MIDTLLTFLSKTLKTDLHYLARGGFLLTLPQISSALLSLILTIAFANLLPIETFGVYKYILSIYALITIATLPGIDTAIVQSTSRGFDGVMLLGFKTKLKWSILATLISIGIAGWNFSNGDIALGYIFIFIGIVVPFMESLNVYTSFLNGKKLFKTWAISDVITQVVSTMTLFSTMYFTKNLYAIVLAYFIPYVLVRAIIFLIVKKKFVANTSIDPELLSYGKSVTLFQVISRAVGAIDQIILFHFLGPIEVAIFSIANAIPTRIQSIYKIVGNITMPKFASRNASEVAQHLPKKIAFFGLFIFTFSILYILIAPYLFTYIFPKYLPSLLYSQVIIFYTLSALTYPISSLLFAHKRLRENYMISIGSMAAKVIALVIFIPIYGIWGAVIGILASSVATIVLSIYFLFKERTQKKAI